MNIVEHAIYELLKLQAGGRVYALIADQNSAVPFIIYQRTEGQRWRTINGPDGFAQARIQVDCYAGDYYACKTQAAAVETILDGYRGTVTGIPINGISLESENDALDQTEEPWLFRHRATYLVTYQQ